MKDQWGRRGEAKGHGSATQRTRAGTVRGWPAADEILPQEGQCQDQPGGRNTAPAEPREASSGAGGQIQAGLDLGWPCYSTEGNWKTRVDQNRVGLPGEGQGRAERGEEFQGQLEDQLMGDGPPVATCSELEFQDPCPPQKSSGSDR